MKVDHSLKGKVVLIGGGGKNLGGLVATEFAKGGASGIAIHYNSKSSKEEAEKTAHEVEKLGSKAFIIQGDFTKACAVHDVFSQAKKHFGKIDIAINTVGKVLKKPILEISEHEYDEMFAVNSKAAFFFIKEAGAVLQNHGKIITIVTSLLGAFTPFYSSYAGSKAPVEHFTRAASKQFGDRGISVTAVGPGPMDTPFFYGQQSKEAVDYHKTAASLSKFSKTGLTDIEDVVPILKHLATDGWWMTGQTVLLNGGYTTK